MAYKATVVSLKVGFCFIFHLSKGVSKALQLLWAAGSQKGNELFRDHTCCTSFSYIAELSSSCSVKESAPCMMVLGNFMGRKLVGNVEGGI